MIDSDPIRPIDPKLETECVSTPIYAPYLEVTGSNAEGFER